MAVGPCGGDGTRLSMPPLRHTIRVVYTRQAGSSVDLIADIGGTNARFAVVQGGLVQQRITLPTAGFGSAAQALAAVRDQTGMAARHIVLAVAGPVTGNSAVLTNGDWHFDAAVLAAATGAADVVIINDFHAAALALPTLQRDDLRPLGGPQSAGDGVRAILGPGTGLGTALAVPLAGDWLALPGEGGHALMAPADALELELYAVLQQRFDPVTWEHVLSGPGLVNLYSAVCALWGSQPQLESPQAIVSAALETFEPVCDQTLGTFCNLLGSAAGNLLVTLKATGGVYIAGGLAQRLADYIAASHFRRRFEERGAMSELARDAATLLVTAEDVGLRGALVELQRRCASGGHQAV